LGLAFFCAIQSLQHTTPSANINKLIANTFLAYQNLPLEVCQKVWTTAQMVMNEIILIGSNNRYKLPHAKKDKIVMQLQRTISYHLPCLAMTDNGKLDFECIVSFMTRQGKYDRHVIILVIQSSCRSLSSNHHVTPHCHLVVLLIIIAVPIVVVHRRQRTDTIFVVVVVVVALLCCSSSLPYRLWSSIVVAIRTQLLLLSSSSLPVP
jgi:hypothetical protein